MVVVFLSLSITHGSFHDFKIEGLKGDVISMSDYEGKKILVVNTASKCGYTPQYEDLQKLSKKYADKLVIIGFPANDFGKQEPGTNDEIAEFCEEEYQITFPMTTKITVKGDNMHEIYKWLTTKELNHFSDSKVKWNFQKYLINERGELIGVFSSRVKPFAEELIRAIESN